MIPATAVIVAVAPAIVIAIAAVTTDAARIAATRVVVAAIIVRAIIESAVPHASAVDRQQAARCFFGCSAVHTAGRLRTIPKGPSSHQKSSERLNAFRSFLFAVVLKNPT